MSDVLLSFGVQNAKADASKMISDLEAAFSNSDPVKIKVGLKVDKSALNTFKSQLSQIVNSISLSNGAPITVKIDGLGDISSQTGNVKKAIDGVSDSAKKASKSLNEMTTSQQRSSIEKLNTLLIKVKTNSKEWAAAADINGGTAYKNYTDQIAAIEELRKKVEDGTVSVSEFADRFSEIKANVASAAAEIQSFDLAKLANDQKKLTVGTKEYQTAVQKVVNLLATLKAHLASWTSAKTGTSSADYKELEGYVSTLEALLQRMRTGEVTQQEFANSFGNVSAGAKAAEGNIRAAGEATMSLGDRIKNAASKFGVFLSVTQVIQTTIKVIKKMVNEVVEIDSAMTELKKVTDETDYAYSKFLDNAASRAKEVGASLTDVISATASYARLGNSISDASALADASIVYKNVADGISSIDEASESIISTMQAFGVEAEDVMSIVDKFNNVSNKYAISSGGIGEALQKSAAAMHAAGNTLDETIALITAANTTVQNPETVGTTLKTVSMYLRAAKTEAESAGESTDGMANSVSELRDEILKLTGNAVDIQIDENRFKSTYQILKEIAGVWDNLSDISQANLLEMLGGKRNANVLSALLGDFDLAEDVLRDSMESAGSALAENEKYLDSIAGKMNQFKASFEALSNTVVNSDLVKVIIDAGTTIMDILNGILDLTGSIVPLLSGGAIYAFIKNLDSLNNLGKFSNVVEIFKQMDKANTVFGGDGGDEYKKTAQSILGSLDLSKAIEGFRSINVEGEQLSTVLVKLGFDVEDVDAALGDVTKTGGKSTSLIGKMKSGFSGLAASIGVSTTALAVFTVALAAVAVGYIAWQKHNEKIQECVENAKEASAAIQEETASINEQKAKVEELRTALDSGNLSEEESYNTKSQLLSIQQSLVGTYGEQAAGIDVVNGKLEEEIALMDELIVKQGNKYLNENEVGIKEATKQIESDRNYRIGTYTVTADTKEAKAALADLVDKYPDFFSISTRRGSGRAKTIHYELDFNGTAEEATVELNNFMTDVRELKAEFSDNEAAAEFFDNILERSSDALNKANEVIQTYQGIYDTARQYALITDTKQYTGGDKSQTAAAWMNEYSAAVQEYNDALASGDPSRIAEAAASFQAIDSTIKALTGEGGAMSQYAQDAANIANQLDTASIAANNFYAHLLATETPAGGGNPFGLLANQIKELGLTDIDLQNMLLTDDVEEGEEQFRKLIALADYYRIDVEALIPLLVKWGYVSSKAGAQAENSLSGLKDTAKSAADATQNVLSMITGAQEMIASQGTGKSISIDNFNTAELNGYADALEYVNGALQLNTDRVNELVKAKAAEQIATNDANKAAAQTKYLENAKQLRELRKQLAECGDDKKDLRTQIEKNIEALTSENGSIKNTISEYDLMSASLREATSAYQHWLNSQNASQTGDMFDSSLSAIQHIADTLNNAESDLYGRIGRSDYKAAVDFIVPDSVDREDADAVASYIDSISDMFIYDSSGNRAGLNIANFCQQAVDAGLMVLNEAGTDYEIVGGKTMEDFANGLGLALPLVQAMFGELQEFGADFSWADEAGKTLGDLAIAASDAFDALSGMDGNETLKINIDATDAETLESTIKEMQDFKIRPDVDASEIEYANQIIEYCLAKKQLLCAPDIMMVDTSVVEGNLGNAIAILQEFQTAKNNLEHAQTLGLDTTQAQANLDAATAKVQALDSNITSEKALNIDTTSVDTIADSLQSLTADIIVMAGVDESAVIGYQQSEHDSTGTVTMEVDSSAVDEYIAQTKVSSGTVVWDNDTRLVKTSFSATGWINWQNANGSGSASGTAHAGGTANAGGDWGTAPGGRTLVGELGPEIVVNVHSGKWYTVGDRGAEFRDIPPGSIVFNHEQSKALLEHGYVSSRGHSMASGTAMVSGSIPVNGRYPGSGSSGSGGSSSGSGSGGSNNSSSGSDDAKTWFEEAYAYHQHLLAMDQESMEDYLKWLEDAYRQAYAEGIIELEDMYKYEEECYEKSKEIFNDYLNDIEFKIEGLARQDGTASQIVNIYLSAIQDINNKIAEARARGLNDNDDYIQELIKKLYEYEDAIEDIRDDATDNAKNAVDDLIQYRIKMLKQDLQNEKDALEDKKSALKDFYNEQKQMLQDVYDEEKTQEEREEKRKAKSDIEAELAQLEFDDSAWAQKRKLELQKELADAQKDLDDFEKEQTLNNTQDMLDDMYEKQAEQIQTEIDAIEEALNNPEALYNQALRDIQNNTQALFEEMVQYNARYGDGDPSTVKEMWDEAKKSLDDFLETFGRAYKDIILVDSPSGYASGTSNATRGIHKVDEKGSEWLFTSGDGTKYRVFSGGEKVLDANATNFLYNFATTGGKILSDAFSSLLNAIMPNRISNQQRPLQISTGDIIIQGNANEKTVSEIRRAQRDNVEYILKEFTKLNK